MAFDPTMSRNKVKLETQESGLKFGENLTRRIENAIPLQELSAGPFQVNARSPLTVAQLASSV